MVGVGGLHQGNATGVGGAIVRSVAARRALRVAGQREAAEKPVDAREETGRLARDAGDVGAVELVAQLPAQLVPGRRASVNVEAATRDTAEAEKRDWCEQGGGRRVAGWCEQGGG